METLVFPSFEEIKSDIAKKLGKRPSLPKDLLRGNWTEQALKVLEERYLIKDDQGKLVETPDEMCWRVAWEIASAEARWGARRKEVIKLAEEFYLLLINREFLPNSPTLMNAGTNNRLQYSGCFVIPIEDSLTGIFDALKSQALIHQTGGGTGFSFSRLRPRGSVVKSSHGVASGPVSFMRIFDAATNEIKQGGKRRGANMGILRVDHPDILEFIQSKKNGEITNFNISVAITDKFMKAYFGNKNYNLVNPKTGKSVGKLNAREVFNQIVASAWETGDPGLVFIDRINRGTANPVPSLGPIESTNPCGEQPLYHFDSCNLGSIFLTYFVKEQDGRKVVDWEKLQKVTAMAVRFLDDVIEVNPYALPQIRQTTLALRRIGLGVGGWADMLVELGIAYDSSEALKLAGKIMKAIGEAAIKTSRELAKKRGAFPLFPISIYKDTIPRRNSTLTTIAPTGSISIIAGASSGIEPLFAIAYRHIVKDKHLDRKLFFVNPIFKTLAEKRGFWTENLEKKLSQEGVIRRLSEIPEDIRAIFGTAHEIDPQWHIRTQVAFQKYTENAVSKTINIKHEASVDDVKKAYLLAWRNGCKGITIFRDGSKASQVLNLGLKVSTQTKFLIEKSSGEEQFSEPIKFRPFKLKGMTYKLVTPVGSAFVTINENENKEPMEIFINVGKAGSDVAAMAEALGRTISTALRFRGNLSSRERANEIAHQLSGIGGRRSVGFGPNRVRSLPDAVSLALSVHYGFKINGYHQNLGATSNVAEASVAANGSAPAEQIRKNLDDPSVASAAFNEASNSEAKKEELINGETQLSKGEKILSVMEPKKEEDQGGVIQKEKFGDICPSCGASTLIYEEGCSKCFSCGHSEC